MISASMIVVNPLHVVNVMKVMLETLEITVIILINLKKTLVSGKFCYVSFDLDLCWKYIVCKTLEIVSLKSLI